jgi:predicted metal-binding membrane protein
MPKIVFWSALAVLMVLFAVGIGGVWPVVGIAVLFLAESLVSRSAQRETDHDAGHAVTVRDVVLLVLGVALLVSLAFQLRYMRGR